MEVESTSSTKVYEAIHVTIAREEVI